MRKVMMQIMSRTTRMKKKMHERESDEDNVSDSLWMSMSLEVEFMIRIYALLQIFRSCDFGQNIAHERGICLFCSLAILA